MKRAVRFVKGGLMAVLNPNLANASSGRNICIGEPLNKRFFLNPMILSRGQKEKFFWSTLLNDCRQIGRNNPMRIIFARIET